MKKGVDMTVVEEENKITGSGERKRGRRHGSEVDDEGKKVETEKQYEGRGRTNS